MRAFPQTYDLSPEDQHFWSLVINLLGSGKRVRFNPVGSSMSPFIRNGEPVIVEPCHVDQLAVGDIILYVVPGSTHAALRIHRILKRARQNGRDFLLTRGDALGQMDSPVERNQVLGRISSIGKRGWSLDLNRPLGKTVNLLWTLLHRIPASYQLRLALHRGRYFLR